MPEEALKSQEDAQTYWKELETADREGAPAPAAAPDPASSDPGQAGQPAEPKKDAAAPPQDDWAGVPKVVKDSLTDIAGKLNTLGGERLDRIENALKATVGRVGSIQSELAKQTEMHKAATAAAATTADAPTAAQLRAAVKDPEKWTRLKADFPEWADGVADYLEARLAVLPRQDDAGLKKSLEEGAGKVTKLEENVTTLLQRDEELREMVVEMKHAGWKQTVNTDQFKGWFAGQPTEVKSLGKSDNPMDAIRLLDLYGEHSKKAPDPEQIAREREERLKQSASITGKRGSPPSKQWTEEEVKADPDGYWKHLDEQERAAKRASA